MVGWGLQSHFHVQPNNCVKFVLCCLVVGVVTIVRNCCKSIGSKISNILEIVRQYFLFLISDTSYCSVYISASRYHTEMGLYLIHTCGCLFSNGIKILHRKINLANTANFQKLNIF